jgi:hypothetical protein
LDKQSIVDHFERAQFFIQVADSIPFDSEVNEKRKCWFYLAAVYSLRAAWEITKKGIEEKLIVGDAESFKEETKKVVSYYDTVDRIRIQDYHVHGIRLKRGAGCALGKTTMSTGNSPSGSAAFFLTPEGPQIIKEKSGFVKQERPVSWREFEIYCEEEKKYVFIGDLFKAHGNSLSSFLEQYFALLP